MTAWKLTRLAWNERKERSILRSLPLIILALCNTLLFAVAGVFSSEVTKAAGNETLIMSPNCGYILPNPSNLVKQLEFDAKDVNDILAAITYSRACYGGAPNELQCGRFRQPKLAYTSEMNVSCPFQSNICREGPSAAFQIKSGWIDTHKDLGINTKPSDRLQYRRVSTCSVLQTKNYVYQINSTRLGDPVRILYYNYGPIGSDNFTFEYNLNGLDGFHG